MPNKKALYPMLWISCLWLFLWTVVAQADEEADRQQLREMLANVEQAINDRDLSTVIDYFLPESVVVFQNKTVLRGPDDLNAFFDKMLGSENSVLTDVKSTATIGAPAQFYDADTAVAQGELLDDYSFRGGSSMALASVWTTTLVRVDDSWRIASLHFSANVFDNPIIDKSKRLLLWGILAGTVIGFALTWLIMRRRRKVS